MSDTFAQTGAYQDLLFAVLLYLYISQHRRRRDDCSIVLMATGPRTVFGLRKTQEVGSVCFM